MVTADRLRIVFFGTPEFAVPTLDALVRSRHVVAAAVSQPDRPRDRGQKTASSPVKTHALAAGIPVLQPERLRDPEFGAALADLHADLGVVAAYGKILTEAVLSTPRLGMVNVHASLLPRYRGAAPVHRAIIAGESETGVTIMRVVKALDAGPMLATVRRSIGPDETSDVVERHLAQLGASLLVATIDRIAAGTAEEVPQDDAAATYAPRLTKDEGLIDWTMSAQRIHDLVRGLFPWPHAYTYRGAERFIIWRTAVRRDPAREPAGTIVDVASEGIDVAAGDGIVSILEIQPEGRRPMPARDFLAGHRLAPGDRFSR